MIIYFNQGNDIKYNSPFDVFSHTGETLKAMVITDGEGLIIDRFIESDLSTYSENEMEIFMLADAEETIEDGYLKLQSLEIIEATEDEKFRYFQHHEGFLIESKKTGDTGFYNKKEDADFA